MFKKDLELERTWAALLIDIEKLVGKKPKDLNAILFLIGVQELGKGKQYFSKEEKQDLMHLGICKALSLSGYYELEGLDEDGWPHWKPLLPIDVKGLEAQEGLLRRKVIEYFAPLLSKHE